MYRQIMAKWIYSLIEICTDTSIISLSTYVIMTNVRIVYAKLIDSRGATVCKYKDISINDLPTYVLGNSLSFQEHLKAW